MRSKVLSLVSTFKLIPFQNKLVSLSFLASGGFSYLPTTDYFKLFGFSYFPATSVKIKTFFKNPTSFLIIYVQRLSKISLIELYPGSGIQYARSSGTFAKLIKTDINSHTALLQLPSGVKKTFSVYSLASLGPVSLKIKNQTTNTKSGF
jgi:hypothetical protein